MVYNLIWIFFIFRYLNFFLRILHTIYILSLKNNAHLVPLFNLIVFFILLKYIRPSWFLNTNVFKIMWLANILFLLFCDLFSLLSYSLKHNILILIKSNDLFFRFVICAFMEYLITAWATLNHDDLFQYFILRISYFGFFV